MKIGILTFHRPCNFGANLQAYASSSYFRALGHEVKVIDYVRKKDIEYNNIIPDIQFDTHQAFAEKRLNLTRQVYDSEGLKSLVREEKFDVIIIGADAVWRAPQDDCIFFAKWLFEDKQLSSSVRVASMSVAHMGDGFAHLPKEETHVIAECISQFAYVSVRDSWTRFVVNRDLFDGMEKVKCINPDPVFMLSTLVDGEIWESNGLTAKQYMLMTLPKNWGRGSRFQKGIDKWFTSFKRLVNHAGFQLVELTLPDGPSGLPFDMSLKHPIDPIQWFLTIRKAKAYCGLRFHAIVSCIANDVNFYSMDTYGHSGRGNMLLDFAGLHSYARKQEKQSKIYCLLDGTGLEKHRTGSFLQLESPEHVFKLLMEPCEEKIQTARERLQSQFEKNMKDLLETCRK